KRITRWSSVESLQTEAWHKMPISAMEDGFFIESPPDMNQEALKEALAQLKHEHRDIDDAILALSQRSMPDMIQLQRLKKRKLYLRDEIAKLESQLLPDIIA